MSVKNAIKNIKIDLVMKSINLTVKLLFRADYLLFVLFIYRRQTIMCQIIYLYLALKYLNHPNKMSYLFLLFLFLLLLLKYIIVQPFMFK